MSSLLSGCLIPAFLEIQLAKLNGAASTQDSPAPPILGDEEQDPFVPEDGGNVQMKPPVSPPTDPNGHTVLSFAVKEVAGVGNTGPFADQFVSWSLPIPNAENFNDIKRFGIRNSSGVFIPADFEVLMKDWYGDKRIKWIVAHFKPDVGAFTTPNTGIANYTLTHNLGNANSQNSGVNVTETANDITVDTGVAKFQVSKTAFDMLHKLWVDANKDNHYSATEQLIGPNSEQGGMHVDRFGNPLHDQKRLDFKVTVEFHDHSHVVIKAETNPSTFISTANQSLGLITRIYAFAKSPLIKVVYFMENSTSDVVNNPVQFGWPYYMEETKIMERLNVNEDYKIYYSMNGGAVKSTTKAARVEQSFFNKADVYYYKVPEAVETATKADGWLTVSDTIKGLTTSIRDFSRSAPNRLEFGTSKELRIGLLPEGNGNWYKGEINNLYWLEFMQGAYKEINFWAHGPVGSGANQVPPSQLQKWAKTANFFPVLLPSRDALRSTDFPQELTMLLNPNFFVNNQEENNRMPMHYDSVESNPNDALFTSTWNARGANEQRKRSCNTGNTNSLLLHYLFTQNPSHFWKLEDWGINDIMARPQQLRGYNYDVAKTKNIWRTPEGYCSGAWAPDFPNMGGVVTEGVRLAANYLDGTGPGQGNTRWDAYDDPHAWMSSAFLFTLMTGNRFMLDWYKGVYEFRKAKLLWAYQFNDPSERANGHAGRQAREAGLFFGPADAPTLHAKFVHTLWKTLTQPDSLKWNDRAFMFGYKAQYLQGIMEEIFKKNAAYNKAWAESFALLSANFEYNRANGKFCYDCFNDPSSPEHFSSGTAVTLINPNAYFFFKLGRDSGQWQALYEFASGGGYPLNVGNSPYYDTNLTNDPYGGYYSYVLDQLLNNPGGNAPPNILNLTASKIGGNKMTINWSTPNVANLDRIIFSWYYGTAPSTTYDHTKVNLYSPGYSDVDSRGNGFLVPNTNQSVTVDLDPTKSGQTIYVRAVFLDSQGHKSPLSNQATVP